MQKGTLRRNNYHACHVLDLHASLLMGHMEVCVECSFRTKETPVERSESGMIQLGRRDQYLLSRFGISGELQTRENLRLFCGLASGEAGAQKARLVKGFREEVGVIVGAAATALHSGKI